MGYLLGDLAFRMGITPEHTNGVQSKGYICILRTPTISNKLGPGKGVWPPASATQYIVSDRSKRGCDGSPEWGVTLTKRGQNSKNAGQIMISFKDYLKSRGITCKIAGGFLYEIRKDGAFPDGARWSVNCDISCASPCDFEAARLDYQRIVSLTLSRVNIVAANARLRRKIVQLQARLAQIHNETVRIGGASAAHSIAKKTDGTHSALVEAFLTYKIVEFLQPHPDYEHDDGFHPRSIIGDAIDRDATAQDILAHAGGNPLALVLAGLIKRGAVVETPFEPANGDVMLGLPENLGKRKAAFEERKSLIVENAGKLGLRVMWNEDGTGSIETPSGIVVLVAGSVWDLLSYLNNVAASAREVPHALN
jgi:hypothetical protein